MMMIENVGSCAITPLFISYQLRHQKWKEAMRIYGNKKNSVSQYNVINNIL